MPDRWHVGPGCAVGGGPPASRLRRELRSARRLEARPCPPVPPAPFTPVGRGVLTCACASTRCPARPRHRPRVPQPGPADPPALSTPVGRGVLTCACASTRCPARPRHHPRAPQPGPAAPPAPSTPAAKGVLRHAKPPDGVSSACRSFGWRNYPRFVAAGTRVEAVRPPKCRPIGRKTLKTGCLRGMGLRFGGFGGCGRIDCAIRRCRPGECESDLAAGPFSWQC